ncbi:G-type lectin S-receptor-like serine/threonine-protein kinase SD3-1 [Ipomoea triloba]|uniref:G-type lectin S-receptor-like serine/threonine-protein kinase SD3-1 n=1 Tax=Ipomoea triloba TaxID=35885 RepID=UPI00125E1F61|nr:G-type lectin S-receptor-like serine/threonine-protein kinase SD3-1 [Ipomoea triloba]
MAPNHPQPSLLSSCTTVFLAALLVIHCSQSIVILAQPLAEYKIADNNSSIISWTDSNNQSYPVYSSDGAQVAAVILYRQATATIFACGLFCNPSGTSCLFGILIIPALVPGFPTSELHLDYRRLVWSANRNHPVTVNASVELRREGGLLLTDSNGSVVWSTHSNGSGVSGLNLTAIGNLVIYGQKNETIWQSFDHPTDTLLPGQEIRSGQTLKASISTSNFGEGLYSLYFDNESARAYVQSSNLYWYRYADVEVDYVKGIIASTRSPILDHQITKFEADGHLNVYGWSPPFPWGVISDVFVRLIGVKKSQNVL